MAVNRIVIKQQNSEEAQLRVLQTAFDRLVNEINRLNNTDLDGGNARVTNIARPVSLKDAVNLETLKDELSKLQGTLRKDIAAVAQTALTPVYSPTEPTGVTVVVSTTGENFTLQGTWVPPVYVANAITAYDIAAQYFTDVACTTSDSEVIPLGVTFGGDSTNVEHGPYPRPTDANKYVKFGARSINADNMTSEWVWSTGGLVPVVAGGSTPTAPTQPAVGDWAIATLTGGDYRADKVGNQFCRLRPSLSTMPTSADYVEFWLYKGTAAPADDSLWEYIGSCLGTGDQVENWQPQPTAAETWSVAATASKFTYRVLPVSTSVIKTVGIAAWKSVLPLTTASLALESFTYQGLGRYRVRVTYTRDTSDMNYQATRADMNWCDSTFGTLTGTDGEWKNVAGSYESPLYIGAEIGFDLPTPMDGTQYRQVRVYPIGHDNVPNYTSSFTFNTTLTPKGMFIGGTSTAVAVITVGTGGDVAINGATYVLSKNVTIGPITSLIKTTINPAADNGYNVGLKVEDASSAGVSQSGAGVFVAPTAIYLKRATAATSAETALAPGQLILGYGFTVGINAQASAAGAGVIQLDPGNAGGAGASYISIGGNTVLKGRQSAPTSPPADATNLVSTGITAGYYANSTYGTTEQGYLNSVLTNCYYNQTALAEVQTKLNSLIAAVNSLLSKLNTSGHGLVG